MDMWQLQQEVCCIHVHLTCAVSGAAHEEYSKEHAEPPSILNPPKEKLMGSSPTKTNVWQKTFNPAKNYSDNMKNVGNQYFDHIPPDQKSGEYTVSSQHAALCSLSPCCKARR